MADNLFKGINVVYNKDRYHTEPVQIFRIYMNGKVVWEPGMFPASGGRRPPRGGN